MALNLSSDKVNELVIIAHKAAKPFVIKGMKVGLAAVKQKTEETGTVLDNLLWADLVEAFQVSE